MTTIVPKGVWVKHGKTLISAGNSIDLGSWNAAHARIMDTCRGAAQSFLSLHDDRLMPLDEYMLKDLYCIESESLTSFTLWHLPNRLKTTDGKEKPKCSKEDHTLGP